MKRSYPKLVSLLAGISIWVIAASYGAAAYYNTIEQSAGSSAQINSATEFKIKPLINKAATLTLDNYSLAETNTGTSTPSQTPLVKPAPSPTMSRTPIHTTIPSVTPTLSRPPISANNMVPNPSFEIANGNMPISWKQNKSGTNTAVYTYLTTGHSGNRSYQVQINEYTSGQAGYSFNAQPVAQNSRYIYSAYYRSDVYVEFDAEIHKTGGVREYVYLGSAAPSENWGQYVMQIDTPANATSIVISAIINEKGYFITDDHNLSDIGKPTSFNRPIVSFTFDDFFPTFFSNALPKFNKYGMTATMYLATQDLGQPGFATQKQLVNLANSGFEIGSHAITRPHLPSLSASQLDFELNQSKFKLNNYLGVTITNFASPFGEYNAQVLNCVNKYYASHRSVDIGYNSKDNFNPMNIKAMSVNSNVHPKIVKGWIDRAIQDKTWLVLVYHDVKAASGELFSTTPQDLEIVLAYLKQKNVSVQNVNSALSEIKQQL